MTYSATHFTEDHPSILARSLSAIGTFFVGYAEARSHYREIQALQAKSDAELADLGIERNDIVRRVFSDSYYL